MRVIGITGLARSGKNTVASLIVQSAAYREYAFADALRRMALAVDVMIDVSTAPRHVLEELQASGMRNARPYRHPTAYRYSEVLNCLGYEAAKSIPDFRRFLQRLGTEGVRDIIGTQAWIGALELRLQQDQAENVVMSDVRFPNEEEWVHAHGGIVLRIERPGVGGSDGHSSESGISSLQVDAVIVNDSSVDELQRKVWKFLHHRKFV